MLIGHTLIYTVLGYHQYLTCNISSSSWLSFNPFKKNKITQVYRTIVKLSILW